MKSNRLFIVDDEPGICRVLSTLFTREGWDVVTFHNPTEALKAVPGSDVDVLITDLQMPEMTGVQLLQALRQAGHTLPVLVITAHGTIASAVEAMRLGAFDYLTKPFDMEVVKLSVERALRHGQLQRENAYLREERQGRFELADKGTLFLDEIGDIAATTQLKLLRVLQEREFERVGGTKPISVDVRVIAATNRDLPEAIAKGDLREDLYYRLKVIEIA